MKQRLTSFATVALVAALSAAIVAVAPVQAQGMTAGCEHVVPAGPRIEQVAKGTPERGSIAVLSPSWSALAADAWRASPATEASAATTLRATSSGA